MILLFWVGIDCLRSPGRLLVASMSCRGLAHVAVDYWLISTIMIAHSIKNDETVLSFSLEHMMGRIKLRVTPVFWR